MHSLSPIRTSARCPPIWQDFLLAHFVLHGTGKQAHYMVSCKQGACFNPQAKGQEQPNASLGKQIAGYPPPRKQGVTSPDCLRRLPSPARSTAPGSSKIRPHAPAAAPPVLTPAFRSIRNRTAHLSASSLFRTGPDCPSNSPPSRRQQMPDPPARAIG